MTYKIVRVQRLKIAVFIWAGKHERHVFPGKTARFIHQGAWNQWTPQMEQDFSIIPVKTRKEEYLRRYFFFFVNSVIFLKMGKHIDFHLSYFQIVDGWRDFTVVRKLNNIFKSLYGLGDAA